MFITVALHGRRTKLPAALLPKAHRPAAPASASFAAASPNRAVAALTQITCAAVAQAAQVDLPGMTTGSDVARARNARTGHKGGRGSDVHRVVGVQVGEQERWPRVDSRFRRFDLAQPGAGPELRVAADAPDQPGPRFTSRLPSTGPGDRQGVTRGPNRCPRDFPRRSSAGADGIRTRAMSAYRAPKRAPGHRSEARYVAGRVPPHHTSPQTPAQE